MLEIIIRLWSLVISTIQLILNCYDRYKENKQKQ